MDFKDPSPENDEIDADGIDSKEILSLRNTFRALCEQFPDLILSMTYSDGFAELQICDDNYQKHTLPISMLKESCDQLYDAIFSVKACLKKYDA